MKQNEEKMILANMYLFFLFIYFCEEIRQQKACCQTEFSRMK